MQLGDASPTAAKNFVVSHIDSDPNDYRVDPNNPEKKLSPSQIRKDLTELDACIESVGGRLTDLEFLARRIKMGETPRKAVRQIVEQSASEILKMYILNADESMGGQRKWTPEQAWTVIKSLAATQDASLRYNEMVLNDSFKIGATGGPDAVLQALEQGELISLVPSTNGRPQSIKPGKPVFHAAFQRLTEDKVLSSRLELSILTDLIKGETSTIDKAETELKLLGEFPSQPQAITPRVKYLLSKIATSQMKIEVMERDQGALKKVLLSEY
jgi:hypothetical protein